MADEIAKIAQVNDTVLYTPEMNGRLTLPQREYLPRPENLFQTIIEKGIGGTRLAVLHGSYVYLDSSGPMNRTYRETRVYRDNVFQASRFNLVGQPPDVDVVTVVDDLQRFDREFNQYVGDTGLVASLNHFIEMTVITEEVLRKEIARPDASGMKTIFALKPLIGVGETDLMGRIVQEAKSYTTQSDIDFQTQYEKRKKLYRVNGELGVPEFLVTREDYITLYPELLKFYDTGSTSAFPQERVKVTLPRPLKLRAWEYYDVEGNPIDISTMKIND